MTDRIALTQPEVTTLLYVLDDPDRLHDYSPRAHDLLKMWHRLHLLRCHAAEGTPPDWRVPTPHDLSLSQEEALWVRFAITPGWLADLSPTHREPMARLLAKLYVLGPSPLAAASTNPREGP